MSGRTVRLPHQATRADAYVAAFLRPADRQRHADLIILPSQLRMHVWDEPRRRCVNRYLPQILMQRIINAMTYKRWGELDPRLRQAIMLGGAFEAGLKVAVLIDLAQRPSQGIRGSKVRWAAAVTLVNSAGLVPILYLLRGRRR